MSRELDHHDPIPGRYTLEVTSPGVERALRTPAHFRREVGKVVAIRLSDVGHDERRVTGTLVAADDDRRHAAGRWARRSRRAGDSLFPDRSGPHRLRVGPGPEDVGPAAAKARSRRPKREQREKVKETP